MRRLTAIALFALSATMLTATPALATGGHTTVSPSGWCCRG
jgi:hypothetical protein